MYQAFYLQKNCKLFSRHGETEPQAYGKLSTSVETLLKAYGKLSTNEESFLKGCDKLSTSEESFLKAYDMVSTSGNYIFTKNLYFKYL